MLAQLRTVNPRDPLIDRMKVCLWSLPVLFRYWEIFVYEQEHVLIKGGVTTFDEAIVSSCIYDVP